MTSIIIDNEDFFRVNYVGNWIIQQTAEFYGGTASGTTNDNDYFTVAFKGSPLSFSIVDVILYFEIYQERQYLSMGQWIR